MKPKSTLRNFLSLAGSSLLAFSSASAAALYWDGNDTNANANGGAGTWSASLFNWDTLAVAGTNSVWTNANLDTAVFGGTASTSVLLGSNIDVGGLTFNTTGYGITTTGFSLNFADTVNPNTILFNNIAAASITGPVGGAGNVVLSASNPATAGILTLNGTSTGGWTGSTTINAGMTMSLSGLNQALKDTTTSITLNGGGITLTSADVVGERTLDRVSDTTGITSNGGTITYTTTTAASANAFSETIGAVTLNRGQLNLVQTLDKSAGSQTLALAGLSQSGTSAITLSNAGGLNTTNDIIRVNGITASTTAGQIIGPWATVGTTAAAQTDYAVYNSDGVNGRVVAAGIGGTAETTWTTAANAYTMTSNQVLTGTRTITALRSATASGGTLTLTSGNLETYGLLSGGQTLAVNGPGALTTPTGGGNLYITTGGNSITVAAPINNATVGGGAVTLVKSGNSNLTLSSTTSNFSGGIVLNAGGLILGSANDAILGVGGGITVNGAASIDGKDKYDYARTLTLNEGGALTLSNGFGVTGVLSGNGTLNVTSADSFRFSNAANTYSGAINSASAGTLTYGLEFASIGDLAGAGLISLAGNSGTFRWISGSGSTTTLTNRQFALSSAGGVAASMTTISALGTTAASNLVISKDLLITGTAGARALRLAGTNLGDNTFAGRITDGTEGGASVVTLVKEEAGKWILSGSNTYTGTTTITAGTLQIGAGSTTGSLSPSSAISIGSAGTLTFNRSDALVQGTDFATGISGSGAVTKLGGSTLTLNSANTYTGLTTVTAGKILMTHALALQYSAYNTTGSNGSTIGLDVTSGLSSGTLTLGGLSGNVNLASAITAGYTTGLTNLTLNPQTGVTATYSSAIAGATVGMSLTKTGAGTQVLNGGSSFTGGVTISGGNLTFGASQGFSGGVALNAATLQVNAAQAFTGGISINGGDLRLATSGTTLLGSNVVTFAGSGSVNSGGVSGGGTFVLPSVVVNSGTATFGIVASASTTYTFTNGLSGSGNLTFSGGTTGPGNNKNVTLNNASGFTGTLSLNWSVDSSTQSNLNLSGLGDGGKIILNPGANGKRSLNITYTGAAQTFDTRQIELGSTFGGVGMIINSNGTGPLVFNTALSVTASGSKPLTLSGTSTGFNNAFNGQIVDGSGTINLIKSGASTWNVTHASNNYTGGTTVNGGTLGFASGALGTTGTINASGGTLLWLTGNTENISSRLAMTAATTSTFDTGGNNITFGTGVGGGTTALLTKTGLGTLTLQGNNTYTGITTVNAGTLLLDMTGSGALAATSALTLGGGEFSVKGGATSAQTVGALVLTANTGSKITIDPNNGTSTILTVGDAWTRNTGSTLLIDYSSTNTGTRELRTANATTGYTLTGGIYGGIMVKDSAGVTGFATRAAGSNIAITRYDDTTGSTLVDNSNALGTNFTTLNTVYTSGTLNWNNVITTRSVNSLTIDTTNNGGTINMGAGTNVLTLGSLGILFKGTNDSILTGGTVGASASEVIVHQTSSTNTLTINSPISAAAGSLTKDGVGTLIVGGTNLFTGAVRVSEGAMRLTNAAATGTSAGGITVQNGAALELSGGLNFVADALTITGNGISSGGALKNVSGANLYQGAITIGNGGARINNADAVNALTVRGITTAPFADVTFGGAGNITHNTTAISGGGGVIKDGAGTLTMNIANTYTGATNVNAGTLSVANTGNINTTSAINVAAGGTLRYNSSTSLAIAPTLAGNGISNRAVLGGTGTIGVGITLDNLGDVLSPGNSPGIQNYTVAQSWSSFSYDWEVNNWTGTTAGADFDQLGLNTLSLTGGSGSYIINVFGLTAGNAGGLVGDGGPNTFTETDRSWIILTSTGITGFDALDWSINTGGFINPDNGNWSITQSGNNLVLNYASAPEPNVAALIGGFGMLALLRRRRN